jgi:LysR family hydrogen peroxide-inducible transcriptional activator
VIGAIPTIAPYFLPSCLASFARKFPRVQISFVEEVSSDLLNLVHEGTVDLALLALPVPTTHYLCRELFRERLRVVVPSNHRLISAAHVHLEQIQNDPFLLPKEGHCFRENTLAACGRARLQPKVVFESGQFTTILAMVAAGTGVSVVPETAVEKREGCRFLPLADDGAYRRIGILQLKQHFRSRVHRALLRHLQERTDSSWKSGPSKARPELAEGAERRNPERKTGSRLSQPCGGQSHSWLLCCEFVQGMRPTIQTKGYSAQRAAM